MKFNLYNRIIEKLFTFSTRDCFYLFVLFSNFLLNYYREEKRLKQLSDFRNEIKRLEFDLLYERTVGSIKNTSIDLKTFCQKHLNSPEATQLKTSFTENKIQQVSKTANDANNDYIYDYIFWGGIVIIILCSGYTIHRWILVPYAPETAKYLEDSIKWLFGIATESDDSDFFPNDNSSDSSISPTGSSSSYLTAPLTVETQPNVAIKTERQEMLELVIQLHAQRLIEEANTLLEEKGLSFKDMTTEQMRAHIKEARERITEKDYNETFRQTVGMSLIKNL